jgi:DNA-binding NtrC family response regulator
MRNLRILIVSPDPAGLALLSSMLKSLGHFIEEATHDHVAVRLMEHNDIDLVLACEDPAESDALELLRSVRREHRELPVILLFPRLHPERAKEALRRGATAVLRYPVPAAELRAAVVQALQQCAPRPGPAMVAADSEASADRRATLPHLAAAMPAAGGPADRVDPVARGLGLVGNDPTWRQVLELAGTIAATRASVLLVTVP